MAKIHHNQIFQRVVSKFLSSKASKWKIVCKNVGDFRVHYNNYDTIQLCPILKPANVLMYTLERKFSLWESVKCSGFRTGCFCFRQQLSFSSCGTGGTAARVSENNNLRDINMTQGDKSVNKKCHLFHRHVVHRGNTLWYPHSFCFDPANCM